MDVAKGSIEAIYRHNHAFWKRQQSVSGRHEIDWDSSQTVAFHDHEKSEHALDSSEPNLFERDKESASKQERLPGADVAEERAFQLHHRYLVVETQDGIEVIDQHALHERVLYEQLRERMSNGAVEVQPLLIPEHVELSSSEFEAVTSHLGVLSEAGVKVESFGGNTVVVRGKPALVGRTSASGIIREVIDRLAALDADGGDHRAVVDEVLHSLSCRAAIKAGDPLSQAEVDTLVADRHRYPGTRHCPHGRPTSLMLSRRELDKQFRRT